MYSFPCSIQDIIRILTWIMLRLWYCSPMQVGRRLLCAWDTWYVCLNWHRAWAVTLARSIFSSAAESTVYSACSDNTVHSRYKLSTWLNKVNWYPRLISDLRNGSGSKGIHAHATMKQAYEVWSILIAATLCTWTCLTVQCILTVVISVTLSQCIKHKTKAHR